MDLLWLQKGFEGSRVEWFANAGAVYFKHGIVICNTSTLEFPIKLKSIIWSHQH